MMRSGNFFERVMGVLFLAAASGANGSYRMDLHWIPDIEFEMMMSEDDEICDVFSDDWHKTEKWHNRPEPTSCISQRSTSPLAPHSCIDCVPLERLAPMCAYMPLLSMRCSLMLQ